MHKKTDYFAISGLLILDLLDIVEKSIFGTIQNYESFNFVFSIPTVETVGYVFV